MRRRLSWIAASVLIGGWVPLLATEPEVPDDPVPLHDWSAAPSWKPPVRAASSMGKGRGTEAVAEFPTAPMTFVAITPCRLIDTRSGSGLPAGYGPPSLISNTSAGPIASDRSFTAIVTTQCPDVPGNARGVAANITAIGFTANGRITIYPADSATRPGIASVNMRTPAAYAPALAQEYGVIALDVNGAFRAFANTAEYCPSLLQLRGG